MDKVVGSPSTSLTNVPSEILLLILSFVDAPDVISLRKTCKHLLVHTVDKSLWLSLYRSQTHHLPVPYSWDWLHGSERIDQMAASRIESLVLSVYLTEARWLSARRYPHLLFTGSKAMEIVDTAHFGTILSMDVMLGRWLVVVHQEGTMALWDLTPDARESDYTVGFGWSAKGTSVAVCRCKKDMTGIGLCTSSAVCMDKNGDAIFVTVCSETITMVVRLNLTRSKSITEQLATMLTPMNNVGAMEPSSEMLIFMQPSSLVCFHWSSSTSWNIPLTDDMDEELWNGVVGIKVLTPNHFLCMRTRSIELHTLPNLKDTLPRNASADAHKFRLSHVKGGTVETIVSRYRFTEMTFRGVSFSEPQTRPSTDCSVVSVTFLAYDVLRGLFHYEVKAELPKSISDPTGISVRLLAAHRMAELVNAADLRGTDTPTPRSMFRTGPRGFVSTCVLGPQGRRGMWIERQRGNMDRAVFGFTYARTAGPQTEDIAETDGQGIDGACLHEVRNSYDLGEDLTHCAFSELTGRVVLGNRRGQLFML